MLSWYLKQPTAGSLPSEILWFFTSQNAFSENFPCVHIFALEKLTTGRLLKCSTIINGSDLHVYSTLHRHKAGCNTECLKALLPPSSVLDLHRTDTNSKNFYPAPWWQGPWQTFHRNILCMWHQPTHSSQGEVKTSPVAFLGQTRAGRGCSLQINFWAVWLQLRSLGTRSIKAKLPFYWATAQRQLAKHSNPENLPKLQFWCDSTNALSLLWLFSDFLDAFWFVCFKPFLTSDLYSFFKQVEWTWDLPNQLDRPLWQLFPTLQQIHPRME